MTMDSYVFTQFDDDLGVRTVYGQTKSINHVLRRGR